MSRARYLGQSGNYRACPHRCRSCEYSIQEYADPNLDESGLLLLTLERSLEAGKLLSYRQGSNWLEHWGVHLSKTRLARLNERFNRLQAEQGLAYLHTLFE